MTTALCGKCSKMLPVTELLVSADGPICAICSVGGTDTTELERKLLARAAIRAIVIAVAGVPFAISFNVAVVRDPHLHGGAGVRGGSRSHRHGRALP
jgi:hypothetical protein